MPLSQPTPNPGNHGPVFFPMALPFPGCHTNGIIQHVLLRLASFTQHDAFLLLSIFHCADVPVKCGMWKSVYPTSQVQDSKDYFPFGATVNRVAVDICIQVLVWVNVFISLG